MVKKKNRTAGFTLVELMIVVAILGIVASIGARLIINTFQFYRISGARTDIQQELRVILDHMNRRFRQASAATVTISQDAGQPPYSKISFTTVDGTAITYKQSGQNLVFIFNGKQDTLSKNLRYLAFTEPQTDINTVVSISATLEKATYSGKTAALQMAITKVRIMNP